MTSGWQDAGSTPGMSLEEYSVCYSYIGNPSMSEPINEINLKNLDDFVEFIDGIDLSFDKESGPGYVSDLLFRGQANANWKLESTLDRYIERTRPPGSRMTVRDYYDKILAVYPAFASYTGLHFELAQPGTGQFDEQFKRVPLMVPGYEFAIHLRHHGFPSPLLDWTKSPYVAAFFAYNGASPDHDVSIYCFREHVGKSKGGWSDEPRINGHGPYVITHDRHYRQQAQYTTCTVGLKDIVAYAP
jgi:hypothetical protein